MKIWVLEHRRYGMIAGYQLFHSKETAEEVAKKVERMVPKYYDLKIIEKEVI